MFQDMPEQQETRALAMAGLTLVESLIATLAENEILSADQTNRLFQVASQSLAKFPQPDPGVKNARVLVNGIATLVAEHLQRQPK